MPRYSWKELVTIFESFQKINPADLDKVSKNSLIRWSESFSNALEELQPDSQSDEALRQSVEDLVEIMFEDEWISERLGLSRKRPQGTVRQKYQPRTSLTPKDQDFRRRVKNSIYQTSSLIRTYLGQSSPSTDGEKH